MSTEEKAFNSGLRWFFKWENLGKTIVTILGLVVAGTAYYYSATAHVADNTRRICTLEETQKTFATKSELQTLEKNNQVGFEDIKDDIKEVKEQNKQILQYLLDQKKTGR